MRRLFEKFVRNFYHRRLQSKFTVTSEQMKWSALALGSSDINLLPQMITDVSLRSDNRTIIIECKFTESL
jgi:5-methylcytosine-specific restriction endonuclease McrBC regulatory subunit McrC